MVEKAASRSTGPWPRRTALGVAAAALAGVVWSLASMTVDRAPTVEAGEANLTHLWPFWVAAAAAWAALTVVWMVLRRTVQEPSGRGFARDAALVLAVGLAARVAVLLAHTPASSDDVYRYVFDGRNAAHGVNPYLVIPADRARSPGPERWPREAALADRINNPEMTTIYLPTSQWVFAVVGVALGDTAGSPDAGAAVLRAVLVGFEVVAVAVVLLVLWRSRRSAWWAVLYAWHPLPLAEIAGTGHQDVIGIALLVVAMAIATDRGRGVIRWVWAVALAALVKPMAIVVAAFCLRGRPWREWIAAAGVGAVVCAAVAAPLWLTHDRRPVEHLLASGQRFSLKWAHFGSVYEPTLATIEHLTPTWGNDPQEQVARAVCLGILALATLGVWLRGRDVWADCATVFLLMVLLSPAAHPWYLLWALVLVPVGPRPAVWVASLTLPWGYAALADTIDWHVPWWVMVLAYVPVYVALAAEMLRRHR